MIMKIRTVSLSELNDAEKAEILQRSAVPDSTMREASSHQEVLPACFIAIPLLQALFLKLPV